MEVISASKVTMQILVPPGQMDDGMVSKRLTHRVPGRKRIVESLGLNHDLEVVLVLGGNTEEARGEILCGFEHPAES
jgi:hypothetical protein